MILGDDHPYRVIGIGSIWMRMFDGMVRTLTNMKYVPNLKKNLVLSGYLERSGYNLNSCARSGVLNISNGAMVVIRDRRMENNLYRIEGSMVIGEFDIVTAQDQQGVHQLWNYRLGHIEDHKMKELSKYGLILDLDGGIS